MTIIGRSRKKKGARGTARHHSGRKPEVAQEAECTELRLKVGVLRRELRSAEETLRESREAARSLLAQIEDMVFFFNLESRRLTGGNEAFHKLTGYSAEELNVYSVYDIIVEDRASIDERIRSVEQQRRVNFSERYLRCKDGRILTVDISARVYGTENRKLICFIARDVTDHTRLVQALKRSEELYRTLYENNTAAMLLINPLTSTIIDANPTACAFYGWDKKTFRGKSLTDIVASPNDEKQGEIAFSMHGSSDHFFMRQRAANGNTREVEVYTSPVRLRHTHLMYAIIHDVTEKMRTEEELKQSQENLRRLALHVESVREEERTHIAREVHDELGQALTALKMDTRWIENLYGGLDALLKNKTVSMQKLIDATVKSVQRISSELRPGMLDDLGLAAAIEWQTEEFEMRTGVHCLLRIVPEEIDVEKKTATTVFRVFQETLTNIARHAQASVVQITLLRNERMLSLTVRDNGKGIYDTEINDPKSIGLMGIRERVRSHQGVVNIIGRDGIGTAIIVKIPLDDH
ncbi:MAG TPA: PAS domain-containing sensor histidine kinase [Bacteroidota bacterium]|nr:PAS domain-containing sensor histidine kinase [Bacteroidota bacterium]